ncbi:gatB/Yqey [Acetobacter sp. CAG:977]|nr:gatB/Yqey [Acetobacter sp. CAG:977]
MLREQIKEALKTAMLAKDNQKTSTLRLILAAIKDRDIASRGTGKDGTISNDDILQLLQSMIKQRKESIAMYEKGGRNDLVAGEQAEIDTIQAFLPKQMNEDEMNKAVAEIIASVNAAGLKDMGKVMAALREQYAGQMDFGQASGIVKNILAQK